MTTPKLTDVYGLNKSDTFKTWFKNSKVVNDKGEPLVVYHSSPREIQAFRQYSDLGHHFGTEKAANDRASFWEKDPSKAGKKNVYSVFLSIQKPIELPDLGVWEPSELVDWLKKKNVVNEDEATKILMRFDKGDKMEELRNILKKKGYDGAYYKNTVEDPGSTSWITFDGTQVKSTQNKGTWDRKRASIYE